MLCRQRLDVAASSRAQRLDQPASIARQPVGIAAHRGDGNALPLQKRRRLEPDHARMRRVRALAPQSRCRRAICSTQRGMILEPAGVEPGRRRERFGHARGSRAWLRAGRCDRPGRPRPGRDRRSNRHNADEDPARNAENAAARQLAPRIRTSCEAKASETKTPRQARAAAEAREDSHRPRRPIVPGLAEISRERIIPSRPSRSSRRSRRACRLSLRRCR